MDALKMHPKHTVQPFYLSQNASAAQKLNGKQSAAPVRPRNYSPSEFSGALAEMGISICEKGVRLRCALPASDPLHIKHLPGFLGRYYIPESELFRLAGITDAIA